MGIGASYWLVIFLTFYMANYKWWLSKILDLVNSGKRKQKRSAIFVLKNRKNKQQINMWKILLNSFIVKHMIYNYTVSRLAKAKMSDITKWWKGCRKISITVNSHVSFTQHLKSCFSTFIWKAEDAHALWPCNSISGYNTQGKFEYKYTRI